MVLCFPACSPKKPVESNVKESAAQVAEKPAGAVAKHANAAAAPFQDEPAAHALYKQTIAAMRKADSLSYVSRLSSDWKGEVSGNRTYRAWLKKPNYFRVEAEVSVKNKKPHDNEVKTSGILIGDGATLWIYWPLGRYKDGLEEPAAYEKTRLTSYMKKPAPPGGHSIGHAMCYMGPRPILDPSTFFGYTDSLQAYLDGVTGQGTEKVGSEDCDKIDVSFMKHQRSWHLWVSKRDHLPRKLTEIVRVSRDLVIHEEWSSVTVNADIADAMFAWKPPEGWTQWKEPPLEAGLLKPGAKAPDFDLASADGKQIKLSDFRGKVVWFYIWRAG